MFGSQKRFTSVRKVWKILDFFAETLEVFVVLWHSLCEVNTTGKKSHKNTQQTKAFRHLQNPFSRSSIINISRLVYMLVFKIYKGITEFTIVSSRHNYITRHGKNILTQEHRLSLTHKRYNKFWITCYAR